MTLRYAVTMAMLVLLERSQAAVPPTPGEVCITSCGRQADGFYALCFPHCQQGIYARCSSGAMTVVACPKEEYTDRYGCKYLDNLVYNSSTGKCERVVASCPRDDNYHTGSVRCLNSPCTSNCTGRPDGNYPLCAPDCMSGYYIVCSGGITHRMPCSQGWYSDAIHGPFTARMVYDPAKDACVLTSDSCPRQVVPDTQPPCIANGDCRGKADGLYPACSPECLQGHYYTCRQGVAIRMTCSMQRYNQGTLSTSVKGVYDPITRVCQVSSRFCT